jgi:hypothetical protein
MNKFPASGLSDQPDPPNTSAAMQQSDIKQLRLLRNKSPININIDPTATNVGDIELTSHPPSPSNPDQTGRASCDSDQPIFPICTSAPRFHNAGPPGVARIAFDDGSESARQLATDRSRFSIKIPSDYVHDRFRDLADQVDTSRRNRTIIYYRNYFITGVCNILIFYILFSIGIGILHIWSVPIYTFLNITSCVQHNGCECISSPSSPPHTNQSNIQQIVQNNTVIKYLPPLFWNQERSHALANLTLLTTTMVDAAFASLSETLLANTTTMVDAAFASLSETLLANTTTMVDAAFASLSETLLANTTTMVDVAFASLSEAFLANTTTMVDKTIDQIQTIVLDKLTVTKITTNAIDAQSITTNAIDASSSNITTMVAKNISSVAINSDLLDCTDINAVSVVALSLYGNTLNKCTQGKC